MRVRMDVFCRLKVRDFMRVIVRKRGRLRSMRVGMAVRVAMLERSFRAMAMRMLMIVAMGAVGVRMRVRLRRFCGAECWLLTAECSFPELFPRQLFFSGGDHIEFCSADAAAVNAGNFQPSVHPQGLHRPGKDLGRNSGVQQGAKKHVAADPGKAL